MQVKVFEYLAEHGAHVLARLLSDVHNFGVTMEESRERREQNG
jgi:hypothetical protein